ncbi:MAG TPA: hypothetical protein PKD15_03615 [Candidatus Saccharibacteria bacterium]|jgi:uncharacterized protein (TIGR00725 family)|nr:hypothetical protein [Candidatus Saccharibacteria bacterium]
MNYSICVSGAAAGQSVDISCGLAYELGVAVAKSGHILTTGATVGLPLYAAKGAVDAGGKSIGFSPASSLREHVSKYRLPIGFFDYINFTGMHYIGRDIHLVQSSDAVITIGGRMGSLHEFTTALEAHMPCGVLLGSGGLADTIPELLERLEPPSGSKVFFDTDPRALVQKIIKALDELNQDIHASAVKEEWMVKASICEPLAGKFGFGKGQRHSNRMG